MDSIFNSMLSKSAYCLALSGATALFLCQPQEVIAAPVDLSPPKVAVGSADENGNLLLVQTLGSIPLGGGGALPLRLDFSSVRANQKSEFGWSGWSCGVLESTAEFYGGVEYIRVHLLCAKELLLKRDGEGVTYTSLDSQWHGSAGAGKIKVWREDGWELNFQKGKIARLKTDGGREFSWDRDASGKLTGISEKNAERNPLQIEWVDGALASIVTSDDRYDFSFGGEFLTGVDWEQKSPTPKSLRIEQAAESLKVERGFAPPRKFEWSSETGALSADDGAIYRIEEIAKENKKAEKVLVMERSDGKTIRFRKDQKNGISRRTVPSGEGELVIRKLTREGPMFGMIGRIDFHPTGAEKPIVLLQNFYGKNSKLTKRIWRGNPRSLEGYSDGRIEEAFLAMPQTQFPIRNLEAVIQEELSTIEYEYAKNRKLAKVTVNGETALERTFDTASRLITESLPKRFVESHAYKKDGSRETTVELKSGELFYSDMRASMGEVVEKSGRKLQETMGDGRVRSFVYDENDRVIEAMTVAADQKTRVSLQKIIHREDGLGRYEFLDNYLLGKQSHLDVILDSKGIVVARRQLTQAPDWVANQSETASREASE